MDTKTPGAESTPTSSAGGPTPEELGSLAQQAAERAQRAKSTPEQRAKWREKYYRKTGKVDPGSALQLEPAAPPVGAEEISPAPDPVVDPELVESCVRACVETINDLATGHVYRRTLRITEDKALAVELGGAVDVTKPRADLIVKTATVVLQKHALLGQHFPEIALGLGLASWGLGIGRVMKKLDEIEAQRIAENPKKTA